MASQRAKAAVQVKSATARTSTDLHKPPPASRKPTITDEELDAFFTFASPGDVLATAAAAGLAIPPVPNLDDLFEPKPPPLPAPPRLLSACAVCGERQRPRAHPEHDVCAPCAADPEPVRASLERQRRIVVAEQNRAAAAAQAAYDALNEAELARWSRLCELRAKKQAGDATPDEAALIVRTLAGLNDPRDPRFTEPLRACHHADEGLFWANAADRETQRRINARLAHLDNCLADLARAAQDTAAEEPQP